MQAFVKSMGIQTTSSDDDCSCFRSKLLLLLVQPCGKLDLGKKCSLVSEYMPKLVSAEFLEEASKCLLTSEGYEENSVETHSKFVEDMPMVGLNEMQHAGATIDDFCRSYFMFHGIDVNNQQSLFQYLPILLFTESYIYQLDNLNEKTPYSPSSEMTIIERGTEAEAERLSARFKSDPFRPLSCLLESKGLLTKRIQDVFKSAEEYWALERKVCYQLMHKEEISIEEVIKAVSLKGFDYRVLNLLLYQMRGEKVDELHMEFLSTGEILFEIFFDLYDYEKDIKENAFNTLRMFVGIFGSSAETVLRKYIAEGEEKHNNLLKKLDPDLSSNYQGRCIEAAMEGKVPADFALSFGTWIIPPLILDEDLYRSSLVDLKEKP